MIPEDVKRKPGRPKAIPDNMVSVVLSLHSQGLGYRAIARELRKKGVSPDWSTVRRLVKASSRSGQVVDGRSFDF